MGLEKVADYKNLQKAGLKCCCGGRWKASIQSFEMTLVRHSARARRKLLKRTYRCDKTNDFDIRERGKARRIRAHRVKDRQVYKSLCDHDLKPMTTNYILDHNNASQIGKGTDRSIKQFRQGLAKAYKKFGKDFYVIVYDYHNFFGTLDHEFILENIATSADVKWLLAGYIKVFQNGDQYCGIGIGGEPSQDIAVAYCSKIHRMIACESYVIDSGWYMDDGYAIVHTKRQAQVLLSKITAASTKHQLQLNWKRTKIFWMQKDSVTWLKKRTFISDTGKIVMRLTKQNIYSEMKRIKSYHKLYERGILPVETADQSIACWCNYAKPYNSNDAMLRVLNYYCSTFDVSWDRAKILLRRSQKGWMDNRNNSTLNAG